ncbi:MAG: IclR family transcriptional regulator, partial [Anaerolineae bacterium]|nr:IclR family transcriptional regulator [Anaerolineae bacterium]
SLDIPIATVYRTVKYLCTRNYLKENAAADGRYFLGSQLSILAHQATGHRDLIYLAKPFMRELAIKSGQTAQLGILQDYQVVYIEQALPARPVNIIAALRTGVPVNVSASGKVLVANLPESERDQFLSQAQLARQTPESIVEIASFEQELQRVLQQGYGADCEEFARGIGCVAAPIRDHRQQVIAAIGITGHISEYLHQDRLQILINLVTNAAAQISDSLS